MARLRVSMSHPGMCFLGVHVTSTLQILFRELGYFCIVSLGALGRMTLSIIYKTRSQTMCRSAGPPCNRLTK